VSIRCRTSLLQRSLRESQVTGRVRCAAVGHGAIPIAAPRHVVQPYRHRTTASASSLAGAGETKRRRAHRTPPQRAPAAVRWGAGRSPFPPLRPKTGSEVKCKGRRQAPLRSCSGAAGVDAPVPRRRQIPMLRCAVASPRGLQASFQVALARPTAPPGRETALPPTSAGSGTQLDPRLLLLTASRVLHFWSRPVADTPLTQKYDSRFFATTGAKGILEYFSTSRQLATGRENQSPTGMIIASAE
jgi:hypothetical protein